jgi:hypothetical protein
VPNNLYRLQNRYEWPSGTGIDERFSTSDKALIENQVGEEMTIRERDWEEHPSSTPEAFYTWALRFAPTCRSGSMWLAWLIQQTRCGHRRESDGDEVRTFCIY